MYGCSTSRPALHDDEALDGYLERLADANGMSPATLHRLLRTTLGAHTSVLAFLLVSPQPAALGSIAGLGGVDPTALRAATLTRFDDGLPLHLGGFDPRRRHTFRRIVTQGWFPPHGSQACPRCLAQDGIWRLQWRLPLVTVCRVHDVYLLTECGGCQRRFRLRRHSPMRPQIGWQQPCGNPTGLHRHCRWSIVAAQPRPAEPAVVAVAATIAAAMAGHRVDMLGRDVDPRTFLAELRHVATMLLHLLTAAADSQLPVWAAPFGTEIGSYTAELRAPRWGISAPRSARLRGRVLAEANAILSEPTLARAGTRLASWLAPIADVTVGPSNWLINRTTRTATTQDLISAALSGRHHVGRRLSRMRIPRPIAVSTIPQQLDVDLFDTFFAGMLGGYAWTARLYVSLCLARSVSEANSWAAAAARLGLDPAIGSRTARAASGRMRTTSEVFADAVQRTLSALPRSRDFREREARVISLARGRDDWFERWRCSVTPARQGRTLPYAITWMWCEPALGFMAASPAWQGNHTRRDKAGYRAFRDRLSPEAQANLRSLVLADSQG
ncbi:MAG: TniQ family protein [Actinobacteria bacterium]|nr:TniQ family protein [Actinomycetota bacterium]